MAADSVGYAAAFGGGVVSFLSPCVLPLVPGYLSVVTGLEVSEVVEGPRHHLARITRDTGLFVAGFTAVFVVLGLSATALGSVVFHNHVLLTRLSGVALIVMAALLVSTLYSRAPFVFAERRFQVSPSRLGPYAAPVAGAAFGFGWTPCIGPVLASVLAVAASSGQVARGASLLLAYSLGLGLPFLVTGLAFGRMTRAFSWVRRHHTAITTVAAGLMVSFGVLLVANRLSWLTVHLQQAFQAIGLGRLVTLG